MRLTDIAIRALPSPPQGAKIHHCDTLTGFGVRVTSTGVKSFVLTYGPARERRTLGRYPILMLAEARQVAKELLAEQTLGKHRPARLKASEALTRFLAERAAKNKASTLKITEGLIRNHFPRLLAKQLEDVQTNDVTTVTDKLLKKGQPGAAAHSFAAIRTFLKWCTARRYLHHSPIEGLEKPGHTVTRERVLSDEELRTVWRAADELEGQFGDIVKLLILTGQRRGEIGSLQAGWCSIPSSKDGAFLQPPAPLAVGGEDTEIAVGRSVSPVPHKHEQMGSTPITATICLPSTITKNKRQHAFPIGPLALGLLLASQCSVGIIFPARGKPSQPFNGWSKAKAQLDKNIEAIRSSAGNGSIEPWVLHDLRRTYCTNLQRLGIQLEVIEALVNHISGTRAGIVGVYQRHRYEAEMREAVTIFENWFTKTILEA